MCRYIHTRSTLDASKQIETHAQPSIYADTFTHTHSALEAHAGTHSALDTGS
jgi:hypothetical protein